MNLIPTDQLLAAELQNISTRIANSNPGVSAGYTCLDTDLMGGFQEGNLYCFGSVAGMGKTMVALNLVVNQLKNLAANEVLVFVSTGTSRPILIQKLLAIATGIELRKIQGSNLSEEEFTSLQDHPFLTLLKLNNLIIVENNKPTFAEMNQIMTDLGSSGKVPKMLYIDCIQEVQVPNENTDREQAIFSLLKLIKVMALQFKVPVMFTSKVSRRVFYRKDGQIPKLEDLLDSRFIAQVADYVYMVLRPNYYEVPSQADYESIAEYLHLFCRKNKNLPLNMLAYTVDLRKHQITPEPIFKTSDIIS